MPSAADGYESTARIAVWRDGHLLTVEVYGWVFGGVGIAEANTLPENVLPLDTDELAEAERALVWDVETDGAEIWRSVVEGK